MRKLQTGIIVGLATVSVCLFSVGIAQVTTDTTLPDLNQDDEATVVEPGMLTMRQREHSKLFKGFGTGKKIEDLLKQDAEVSIVRGAPLEGNNDNETAPSLFQSAQNTTCSADVIIVGKVVKKTSQLTADGEFVFTDYTVNVTEVLKTSAARGLIPAEIIVTGPGGKVRIKNRVATAIDQSSRPFLRGEAFIFFLKFVPNTGSFKTTDGTSKIASDSGFNAKLEASYGNVSFAGKLKQEVADLISVAQDQCPKGVN